RREEGPHLRGVLVDAGLGAGEIVVGRGERDRPERKVRLYLALGDALDGHVSVASPHAREAAADEPSGERKAGRERDQPDAAARRMRDAVVHGAHSTLRDSGAEGPRRLAARAKRCYASRFVPRRAAREAHRVRGPYRKETPCPVRIRFPAGASSSWRSPAPPPSPPPRSPAPR